MLTSFFSKSKPLNVTFVALYMAIFYLIAEFGYSFSFSWLVVLKEFGVLLLFILSMIVLNFIAKKNEITHRNAYKTLLYASFACMLFEGLRSNHVLVANFFILLAFRRIISFKSQRETTKKIFDASFWICIASLFYFWSILFFFLVFFGIVLHVNQNKKNWLIPFIAILTALSLVTSGNLLIHNSFYTFSDWFQPSNFDFSSYQQLAVLVPVSLLFALLLWTLFSYFITIQKVSANLKASFILIFWALLIALAVAIFGHTKNSSELIFFLAPLAIIVTNYLQILKDRLFKEAILLLVVLLPVLIFVGF